jgi:transposase
MSIRGLSRHLGIARRTVRRFLRAAAFPERAPSPPRTSKLAPFLPYLGQLTRNTVKAFKAQVVEKAAQERGLATPRQVRGEGHICVPP